MFKVPGLCNGGNDIQCCIEKKPYNDGDLKGSCIPTNQCTTGNIVSNKCEGGNNIKCCLPIQKPNPVGTSCSYDGLKGKCQYTSKCNGFKVPGLCNGGNDIQCCIEKKPCNDGDLKGSCIPNDQCASGYEINSSISCPGGNKINCCLPKRTRPSDPTSDTIIDNLKKNLKYDSYKNEAMIAAATEMIKAKYDPKFIAGVLGNILNEGTPGEFESSNYVTNPKKEPSYLVYMDEHFDYRNSYSGKSLTTVGIKKAVDLANKAKESGYKGKFGLGMIQWTEDRTNNLLDEYQDLSTTDKPSINECAEIEASFIVKELQTNSRFTGIYDQWKNDPTPYNAGFLICYKYEVPKGDLEAISERRGHDAEEVYLLM